MLATLRFSGVSDSMHMEKRDGWNEPNPTAAIAAPASIVPIDLPEPTIINEIANNIQQISEVMHDTSKRIQDNASAASQLAGLSKDLQKLVGQFTV